MNSLSELNTFGGQTVIVTDSRKAKIVFESQRVNKDSPISFANGVFTFKITPDFYPFVIEEIINYQTCLPKLYITITPSSLSGTTLTRTLVSPVTSTNSNLEYLIANYSNYEDWNKNLEFTWNLPSNLTDLKLIYLNFKLTWFDEQTQTNQEIVWNLYDKYYYYVAALTSKFVPNYEGTRIKFGSSELVSRFSTGPVQGSANLSTSIVATCKGSVTYSISDALTSYSSISSSPSLLRFASSNLTTKVITQANPNKTKFRVQIQSTNIPYEKRRLYWLVEVPYGTTWVINYGDGTSQTYTNGTYIDKTYPTNGLYTITITDTNGDPISLDITKLNTYDEMIGPPESRYYVDPYRYSVRLKQVSSWGETFGDWTNFCSRENSLTNVPSYEPTTNLDNFFYGCGSLNDPNLSYWFNSNSLINGSYAFRDCDTLNVNLNNWNVSQATDMSYMFVGCNVFNQPLNDWNVSNVIVMNGMFEDCFVFNQPLDTWDVRNVRYMSHLFDTCDKFNQSINNWNVSNVTDMSYMFYSCNDFNQPLNNWNVGKVTTMSYMFNKCPNFNQSLNNWNVSNVKGMGNMFEDCYSFNQPLNNWNVSNVTSMYAMFNMSENSAVFNQPLNNWNVSNVTSMRAMFSNCRIFNQPLNNWNVGKVTSMIDMFANAQTFDQDISNWRVTQIASKPSGFDTNTSITWTLAEKPKWGV